MFPSFDLDTILKYFFREICAYNLRDNLMGEFNNLEQGSRFVVEYEVRFHAFGSISKSL